MERAREEGAWGLTFFKFIGHNVLNMKWEGRSHSKLILKNKN
jgi:hypothetical protein